MGKAKRWEQWREYWGDLFFRMEPEEFDHWERRMRWDEHLKIPGLKEEHVIRAVVSLADTFAPGKHPKLRDLVRTIRTLIPKDEALKNMSTCGYCKDGFLTAIIDGADMAVWCNCEQALYLRNRNMKDEKKRVHASHMADLIKEKIEDGRRKH